MTALRRTAAAGFTLTECLTLEAAKELAATGELAARLLPMEQALAAYPAITVSPAQAARFRNGGALALERIHQSVEGIVRVYHPDGTCIGLGNPVEGELKMDCLLNV